MDTRWVIFLKFGLACGVILLSGLVMAFQWQEAQANTNRATIALTKSVDKTTINPGDTVAYTITYQNTGSVKANGLVITDAIPDGITYVNASASNKGSLQNNTTLKWDIGTVDVNASGSVSFKATINVVATSAASAVPTASPSPSPSPGASPSPSSSVPAPAPSPTPSPSPGSSPPPSPSPSPSGGSSGRFTKPSSAATIDSSNTFANNLALLVPFTESSGTGIKELISGQTAQIDNVAKWGSESTEFNGAFVDFTGSNGAGINATNQFFSVAPTSFSYSVLFKYTDFNGVIASHLMDTDKTAVTSVYPHFTTPGKFAVGFRDPANTATTFFINFDSTKPLFWIHVVVTAPSTGTCYIYANISNGLESNSMKLQGTQANCDVYNTWHRSVNASKLYLAGTGGQAIPHTKVAGEWIWNNRALTASEVDTFYADPFAMLK